MTGPRPRPLLLALLLALSAPLSAAPTIGAEASLQVLPISTQHWIGENDIILQLLDGDDQPIVDRDLPVELTLVSPSGIESAPVPATLGRWAVTGRDLYVARATLDEEGIWTTRVRAELDGREASAEGAITVYPDAGTPALGSEVPDVDTPTLLDVGNLTDAISSDPDQVAAFYWKSVTDELRNDQPFVFILDSYAFQPNEACGGALGIIHDIFIEYPALSIIHAEPWVMRFSGGALTLEPPEGPAQLAPWSVAYGVAEPPWVFVVDEDGRLRAKFTGVFGTDELRAAMTAVSGWRPLGVPSTPAPVGSG
jgi:hypothetical protein